MYQFNRFLRAVNDYITHFSSGFDGCISLRLGATSSGLPVSGLDSLLLGMLVTDIPVVVDIAICSTLPFVPYHQLLVCYDY